MKATMIALAAALGIAFAVPATGLADGRATAAAPDNHESEQLESGKSTRSPGAAPESRNAVLHEENEIIFF